MPLFVVEVLVFQVIEVNLGVLLLAKLCFSLEMLIKAGCDLFFFWSSTNSELNFCKTRSLLLKILDLPLYLCVYHD